MNSAFAAQYLRMSTDHQQYSLVNQADVISRYAAQHDLQIVKTYSDGAKSGLLLRNRAGLKQLLRDVLEGNFAFRAILVYDVSRWGRFQDIDEAAHYEYLCKSAGAPIHYCAEIFANANHPFDSMMKALKRTMAGEYSRELSIKVKAGLTRLAKLGYKLGGSAPYGLRRQLLDVEGRPKQCLEFGQRKSIANERVTLVPGPQEEVVIVNRIFREFADERRSVNIIANQLNTDAVAYLRGATWKGNTLRILLQDPRYIGMQVWGRTTEFLCSPVKRLPFTQWIIHPNAFQSIVPYELFLRAQQVFATLTVRLSDEQMLERLGNVYKRNGYLSAQVIDRSPECPGLSTYNKRFGGLMNVYERLGYDPAGRRDYVARRQRGIIVRRSLIADLLNAFPNQLQEIRKSRRFRPILRCRKTGLLVSIVFARRCQTNRERSWLIETARSDRKGTTLLVLFDPVSGAIDAMKVFTDLPRRDRRLRVREDHDWWRSGIVLPGVGDFFTVLSAARSGLR